MRILTLALVFTLAGLGPRGAAAAPTPSVEELWRIVQQQQKTIEQLSQKLDTTLARLDDTQSSLTAAKTQLAGTEQKLAASEQKLADTTQKIEATADAVEAVATKPKSVAASWAERTSIGGYGELHYNNLHDRTTAGDGSRDDVDQTDLHRFVIYFSHEFNDWLRFGSELEVEHVVASSDPGDPGEVEVEQAWIEMDLKGSHKLRAGLDLLPVGLINPSHEPNTFYGVERNPVESQIIPTTWWEAGTALRGDVVPGLGYDLVLHTGLVMPTTGGDAFQLRHARTEIAEADGQDVAATARLRYTAIPGLEVAMVGQYQADYTGTQDAADVGAYLLETHLDYKHASGFGLRALYAHWHFDSDRANGVDPRAMHAANQDGWYVEPAYRFALNKLVPLHGEAGVFARYSQWDQADGFGLRFREYQRYNIGLNYWPMPQVVFKIDGQWESANGLVKQELDGFNLGVGYQF